MSMGIMKRGRGISFLNREPKKAIHFQSYLKSSENGKWSFPKLPWYFKIGALIVSGNTETERGKSATYIKSPMKWHLMLMMVYEELPNLALLDTFIVRRLCAHRNMCHCMPPPPRPRHCCSYGSSTTDIQDILTATGLHSHS